MAGTHLEYIQEWSICKKRAAECGCSLICRRQKERGGKRSPADPETRMKLCSLLIRSPAETGRTVMLVKQSKVTSPGSILINCWKVHGLLLCFDSLFMRSCFSLALHLCIHGHIAIGGVGSSRYCAGPALPVYADLNATISKQPGWWSTGELGLCVPGKQHSVVGHKLLVIITSSI